MLELGAVLLVIAGAAPAAKEDAPMKPKLEVVDAKADGKGWRVVVALTFTNDGKKTFDLDKVSVCEGGRIANHVFQVMRGADEVPYQGMMAKRAPPGPDGFIHLAPGKSVRIEVRLDGEYAFPKDGGDFAVRFETANHFSKDDVQLVSNEVRLTLAR